MIPDAELPILDEDDVRAGCVGCLTAVGLLVLLVATVVGLATTIGWLL